jgi:hypothetical protein
MKLRFAFVAGEFSQGLCEALLHDVFGRRFVSSETAQGKAVQSGIVVIEKTTQRSLVSGKHLPRKTPIVAVMNRRIPVSHMPWTSSPRNPVGLGDIIAVTATA